MSSHGSRLRKARHSAGLSLEALAREAGVSTATVYRAEHGRHQTADETWEALARALGLPVDELHEPEAATAAAAREENGAAA